MRFADGAVAPGYNVQVAVDSKAGFILAVRATDRRKDSGLASQMVEAAVHHTGRRPRQLLVDTGYATHAGIENLANHADPMHVYAPPPPDRATTRPKNVQRRKRRRTAESDAVKAWRRRMTSDAGKATYHRRGRIERINANLKNRRFATMLVRGLEKVQAVSLLHALAHNMMTAHRLTSA